MVDYLEEGRTINGTYYAEELEAAASGDCEEEERKIDSRTFCSCKIMHLLTRRKLPWLL